MNTFPNKKYQIIYADPPWAYQDKALNGNRGLVASTRFTTKIGYLNCLWGI
jgi:hypothetical protein